MKNKKDEEYDFDSFADDSNIKKLEKQLNNLGQDIRLEQELNSPLMLFISNFSGAIKEQLVKRKLEIEENKQNIIHEVAEEYKINKQLNEEKLKLINLSEKQLKGFRDFTNSMEEGKDMVENLKKSVNAGVNTVKAMKEASEGNISGVMSVAEDIVNDKMVDKATEEAFEVKRNNNNNRNKMKNRA